MQQVVIAGGGFGGIAAAHRMRALVPDAQVTLIDRATHFAMGFRKTDEVLGRVSLDQTSRPLSALAASGITFVNAAIDSIDPATRSVSAGGKTFASDALLVALGAETVPSAVPGLTEHGIDVYSRDGARAARAALDALPDGSRIVVAIFGTPYKCPPAPFELALLLHERMLGRKMQIALLSPLAMSLPVLGQVGCDVIEGRLAGLMIDFHRGVKPVAVREGVIDREDGSTVEFDLLLAVPPHRVPPAVTDAGLAPAGGWISVNKRTLATSFEGVWAVGDVVGIKMANDMPMPKSGAFAEGAGVVAAEHMAAFLYGGTSDAIFHADGACFLEVGDGEAMLVRGRFLAEPAPEVELTTPSAEFFAQKAAYEAARLAEWFGS